MSIAKFNRIAPDADPLNLITAAPENHLDHLRLLRFMPYPCSPFYADIKSDIRFDNRFDIRLWNSFHVKLYHKSYIW